MSRADELVTIRQPDGSYRRVRRGEPAAEIRTDPHTGRHQVVCSIGGRELCELIPRYYRWRWRARRVARRWLEAERQPLRVETVQ